jgi:hypothetical protein
MKFLSSPARFLHLHVDGGKEMRKDSEIREESIASAVFHERAPRRQAGTAAARAARGHRFYIVILLAFLTLLVSACPLYNPAAFLQHQPDEIASIATQLTLAWNPPSSGSAQVVSYTIEYRAHGTSAWHTLVSIPATSQPSYTVQHSAVGNGSFDFAVSSVDSTGATSPLHTSLDASADPSSGWYVTWGQ